MADHTETDCEKDYKDCKSSRFGVLVEGLADADGEARLRGGSDQVRRDNFAPR